MLIWNIISRFLSCFTERYRRTTNKSVGWAANIFSSNTRCLEHRVEAARAERKTVGTVYKSRREIGVPGWMVKEEVRGRKTHERWYVQRWNIYTFYLYLILLSCRMACGRHGWFIQPEMELEWPARTRCYAPLLLPSKIREKGNPELFRSKPS